MVRSTSMLLVLLVQLSWVAVDARGDGPNACFGDGCTAPCPAENACVTDADCRPGVTCEPGCISGFCDCDPKLNGWACTDDCAFDECSGVAIPAVSNWGVVIMVLAFLLAGSIVIRGRRIRIV